MSTITKYTKTSKAPIPFGNLFPGSLYMIYAERSRGQSYSKDNTIYRKAYDGFYSTPADDRSVGVVLYPEDLVWPLKQVK